MPLGRLSLLLPLVVFCLGTVGCTNSTLVKEKLPGSVVNEHLIEKEVEGSRSLKQTDLVAMDMNTGDLRVSLVNVSDAKFLEYRDWQIDVKRQEVTSGAFGACIYDTVMSPVMVMLMAFGADPATMWSDCTGSTKDLPDSVTEAPGAPTPTGKSTIRELRAPYSGPVLLTVNGSHQVQIAAQSGVARISLPNLAQQAGVDVIDVSASVPNNPIPRTVQASVSQLQLVARDRQQRHLEYLQQRQADRQTAGMCFDRCTASMQENRNQCDAVPANSDQKGDCYTNNSDGFGECIDNCKSATGFDIYMGNAGKDLRPDPYGDQ
jgi:hypothetical protein